LGEVTKQTEGTGSSAPQKTQHAASERELYIPSVDLLTAQVNTVLRDKGRKRSTEERACTLLLRRWHSHHGSGELQMGRLDLASSEAWSKFL